MHAPILDDLLAAFEEVRELARSGRAYRPRDAEEIVQMVISRSEGLGGHLRQLTRLVRLAALCSHHVYLEFFEISVRSARPAALAGVISRGLTEHRVPATQISLEDGDLRFHEAALRPADDQARAFEISVNQVGRLAALHHVLCRFLHYPRLLDSQAARNPQASEDAKGLLWPLCAPDPASHADEVARRLQSALNGHLTRVFESTGHAARQVQVITNFLKSRAPESRLAAARLDLVDNRLLLEFWQSAATSGEEGFKLYRSAVTKMLRYRRALVVALAEFSTPVSIGGGTHGDEIDLDRLRPVGSQEQETGYGVSVIDTGRWHSPLVGLAPLLRSVKILNDTECRQLANYLSGCTDSPVDDDDSIESESDLEGGTIPDFRSAINREFARTYGSALLGNVCFVLRLTRTLLRVDVFDPCQRSIGVRSERGDTDAFETALAGIGEASYRDRQQSYLDVREQLIRGIYASIYILGSLGDVSALVLMARVCDRSVVTAFVGAATSENEEADDEKILAEEVRAAIGARLLRAFGDESGTEDAHVRDLVRLTKRAADQMRRKGFKREQWSAGHDIRNALADASGELVRLLDELDRLAAALNRLDNRSAAPQRCGLGDAAAEDAILFADILRRLYPEGSRAVRT